MDYLNYFNLLDQWDIEDEHQRNRKQYKERADPFLLSDTDFKHKYRFSKTYVKKIVNIIKDNIVQDTRGGGIPAELQVLTALRIWTRQEAQDDAADLHGLSQTSITNICRRVALALASKANLFIFMPNGLEEQAEVVAGFRRICGFRNTIGAIDCTHVKIKKIGDQSGQFYDNRKGYNFMNVQVICDASLKIRDIVTHTQTWTSTHDSSFRESLIRERFEAGEFVGHLIGHSGYALTPYLFTPVHNPRLPGEQAYNRAHILTSYTVEKCFDLWKQRFRYLLTRFTASLENSKACIVALAVLHNIAIDMGEEVEEIGVSNFDNENSQNLVPPVHQQETMQGQVARSLFIQRYF